MELKVHSYDKENDWHNCTDVHGKKHRVDLMVTGSLQGYKPEWLVGRRVWVDCLHPYIEIGMDTEILPEKLFK